MTLVLVGKDLVLKGLSLKIEDKKVPGTYTWGSPWVYNPLIRSPLIRSLPTGHPSGGMNPDELVTWAPKKVAEVGREWDFLFQGHIGW